jgi:hypothetical protein
MAQIVSAFSVPMAMHRLEDCAQLNQELEQLFVQRSQQGDRYKNRTPFVDRNAPVFESNFQLFDWPEPCVRTLSDFCISSLYGVVAELNGYSDETLQRLHVGTESWFHLTGRGGYFGVHNHALHSWSGVYCVRHEGDDPDTLSGRLTFVHPNAQAAMYIDKSNFQLRAPYGFGPMSLRLAAGDLVIFPSWLLHHVQPFEGDGHRITVAFNARFRFQET